jgi:hypothetical protein
MPAFIIHVRLLRFSEPCKHLFDDGGKQTSQYWHRQSHDATQGSAEKGHSPIFNLLPFLKIKMQAHGITELRACLCVQFQLLNKQPDFQETWYERYAAGDHPNVVRFNFLQSVITIWRTYELNFCCGTTLFL